MKDAAGSTIFPGRVASLRSAQATRGETPVLAPAEGALLAALAASKPGGLTLAAGGGELAVWVADAMSITSRLVALVEPPDSAARALLDDDLRIAVHRQGLGEFLVDVEHHRFDLVALESAPATTDLVDLLLARIAPGGFLACAAPVIDLARLDVLLRDRPGVHTAPAREPGGLLVAACGPAESAPRRRGGRAGRRARGGGEQEKPAKRRPGSSRRP